MVYVPVAVGLKVVAATPLTVKPSDTILASPGIPVNGYGVPKHTAAGGLDMIGDGYEQLLPIVKVVPLLFVTLNV